MSRSWERKVRKNTSSLNKQRKKQGAGHLVLNGVKVDRFLGRNYMSPVLLVLFITMYSVIFTADPAFKAGAMYYITIFCYLGLAALMFFRRPYLQIGKDFLQTRRLTGDKRLQPSAIKQIRVQRGYVFITPQKGFGWTFSRLLNRYPTEQMGERLKQFAKDNHISFEQL